jgi:hypothetical protein
MRRSDFAIVQTPKATLALFFALMSYSACYEVVAMEAQLVEPALNDSTSLLGD